LLGCIRAAGAELLDMTQRAVASAVNVEDALRRGLVAYFQFISEHQQSWSLLRHESSLLAGPAGAEIEATRQQQTNLMTSLMGAQLPNTTTRQREAAAEIIVGACERLATWRERHDDVSNEEAAEYVLQSTWFGLQRLTEPVF
ncbi:MAG: TetR family transcriptional regulator, partial [Sciscionella sp.]|nr:TetR family transcriptional regulator [Sciscionella sp.]